MKTSLCILGSTGSIGTNAVEIVRRFPERFDIRCLAARTSIDALSRQIVEFSPAVAAVQDADTAGRLEAMLPSGCRTEVVYGEDGYCRAAAEAGVDTVVTAVVGAAGLKPTLAAIDAGKTIALANKETLVMAGELVMTMARDTGVSIVPVDSEHSAIFQCIRGNRPEDIDRILLTASGGPFRETPAEAFAGVTRADALNHPNWSMGPKITIDSATMMNKGLEVIEACHLFAVPLERIEVVVHPQSIVHSMVAYVDGSVIAQMGVPDMKGAIAYSLSYPERLPIGLPAPDFPELASLHFEAPDMKTFSCLALAFQAARQGATFPAVLNAANEIAVQAFLDERIAFTGISDIVRRTLDAHEPAASMTLESILSADDWARHFAAALAEKAQH